MLFTAARETRKEMRLLDATLREGEQRSGRSFSVDQKVDCARMLDDLGIDYIQVGFPIAQDGTADVCDRVDLSAQLVGIARAIERDIDAAVEAGVDVVEFGIPVSDIQREHVLGASRSEVVEKAVAIEAYARDRGLEVNVSAQDAFRAELDLLNDLAAAVEPATFTLLDTVGAATPAAVERYLTGIDAEPDRLGVHFHNDLGVGTANVLQAADHGVQKADVTVGGIGERVGNAPLEEVVTAGTTGPTEIDFGVDVERLIPTCRSVLERLEEPIPPHKPVLGETAFEHESGMHTATMLDEPAVYEAFDPSRFGGERRLLFGPSSGGGAARRLLERAGASDPSEDLVEEFLEELRSLEEHVPYDAAVELARETVETA